MLCSSRNEITHLNEILPAMYGIVFLGIPHRGSSSATLGKISQEITKVFLQTAIFERVAAGSRSELFNSRAY